MRAGQSDSRTECEECKQQRFVVEFGSKHICRDCVHKALNNKVTDFIQEKRSADDGVSRTYAAFVELYGAESADKWARAHKDQTSVHDVVDHIEKSREIVGKKAAETSVATIKTVLSTRLREAATDAIHEGKTRVREDHIKRFAQSLSDAHNCKYLESEVDLAEFDHLLRNLEVRLKSSSGNEENIPWLVQQPQVAAVPAVDTPALTDMTLTSVCAELLRAAQRRPNVCGTIAKLGAVAAMRKILLGELSAGRTNLKSTTAQTATASNKSNLVGPQHPELQVFMAMLLAEIALQATVQAHRQEAGSNASAVSGGGDMRADTPGAPAAGGATASSSGPSVSRRMAAGLPGDSLLALDILMAGLRAGVKRGEHSLVWSVMCGLRRVSQHPKIRQHLVLQGSVPVVKRTIEFYEAADASLPKPVPRPTAKALTLQGEPPAFLSKSKSQALLRYTGSVKDSWVGSGTSLPALALASSYGRGKRETVDWFAGSPTAIACRVDQRGSTIVRRSASPGKANAVDWCMGMSPTASLSMTSPVTMRPSVLGRTQGPPPMFDALPSNTASMASKLQEGKGQATSHGNSKVLGKQGVAKFPSLMWLISEDGVDEQAFYRCCDKGMVVLQARWLLRDLEHTREEAHTSKAQTVEVRRNPVWDYTQTKAS
jgi:hypothetical protein